MKAKPNRSDNQFEQSLSNYGNIYTKETELDQID